jgi:hypothetical protein
MQLDTHKRLAACYGKYYRQPRHPPADDPPPKSRAHGKTGLEVRDYIKDHRAELAGKSQEEQARIVRDKTHCSRSTAITWLKAADL